MVTNISQNSSALSVYRTNSADVSRTSTSVNSGRQTTTTDTVSLRNESTLAVTYSGNMQIPSNDEARFSMLRNLVINLLQEQGINTKIAIGDSQIDLSTVTPAQAQELLSEDGYFGVEKTSDRIFQFAVGIAGGDPARIDAIKAGIDKGFAEAKKAFGDWLPDISYATYDAVMQKLDKWVADTTAPA
ncbi:MAG: hypothetical protein FWF31_05655 [Desulfobulbus sp.]|nr:hypothetical protein [Desulfobulbus sp.]